MSPHDITPESNQQAAQPGVQVPDLLVRHLERWIGAWPPASPPHVIGNPRLDRPAWDGRVHPVAGIITNTGAAVVGVPPLAARAARRHAEAGIESLIAGLPDALGIPDGGVFRGAFRWSTSPADLPDAGVWLSSEDPRVAGWLRPFGGEVLVALEDDRYLAGVGLKKHDAFGKEIAVGTAEEARGRGLARRLVAQAARRVLAEGSIPTYLHATDNLASARVAQAAGFADHGWQVLAFFRSESDV